MIKRLAFLFAPALCAALPAQALFFTPPPMLVAAPCTDTSVHTVTSGAGSVTVPAGCHHATLKVWGGGASGSSAPSGYTSGGGGGAYATSLVSVTPSQTLYWYVGTGGAAVTASSLGNVGGPSWENVGSNVQPSNSSTGALAAAGSRGIQAAGAASGGLTASCVGSTSYAGGSSTASNTVNTGGGGGAGSGGAGGGTSTNAGGAAGTPDGGAGGAAPAGIGNGTAGTQPGGGGGTGDGSGKTSGAGAAGQITYQWSS